MSYTSARQAPEQAPYTMAKKKKTAPELQIENRMLRRYRTMEAIVSVINNLVRWGGLVAIAYFTYLSVTALAGQRTIADIGIKFLADVRVSEALAWLFGGSGIAYGLRQRKLRRDTVERIQGRVQRFETNVDPRRTTSKLTTRGETRPEDTTP